MRHRLAAILTTCLCALVMGVGAPPAQAQGLFGKIKDKVKQRASSAGDQAVDRAVDDVAGAVICAITDKACITKAHNAGKPITVTDSKGNKVSSADSAAAISAAVADAAAAAEPAIGGSSGTAGSAGGAGAASGPPPGTGVWLNYDFVPGDKVLFFDDFSEDNVGDLPSHVDVQDGNFTIVDVKGEKYLRTVTGGTLWIDLPTTLPQRFTIEARYHSTGGGNPLAFYVGDDGAKRMEVWCYQDQAGVEGDGPNGSKNSHEDAKNVDQNGFVNCRFMVDGGYVKAYLNEQRLGQLNGLVFSRTKKIKVSLPSGDEAKGGVLLTDIRVAEGGKPLYEALASAGRVSTHGILFATGSATIEGESTPTLKEIGDMLKAHPELKLMIEGHTDNVGAAAANQTLSEQRAAAVKQFLVSTYGIGAGRLQTKGYGASKPVAPNNTPEGRQQNRRVELVKM